MPHRAVTLKIDSQDEPEQRYTNLAQQAVGRQQPSPSQPPGYLGPPEILHNLRQGQPNPVPPVMPFQAANRVGFNQDALRAAIDAIIQTRSTGTRRRPRTLLDFLNVRGR